jgi:hypothetical protein
MTPLDRYALDMERQCVMVPWWWSLVRRWLARLH